MNQPSYALTGTTTSKRLMQPLLSVFTSAARVLFLPLLVTQGFAQTLSLTQVGEWPGFQRGEAHAVAVDNGYAYVAAGGIYIFDTSKSANLEPVAIYSTPDARDVVVIGQHAYVADWETGFQIVDISDPANPRRVGECSISGRARRLVVRDNFAYVASAPIWDGQSNQGGGLAVIDASNPTQPRVVGEYTYLNPPCDLCGGSAYDVAVAGNYAYVAEAWDETLSSQVRGTVAVIDVSDPALPWLAGSYDTSSNGARSVTIAGSMAFVGNYNSFEGLQILDISNPTNPVRVGGYPDPEAVRDVAVVDDLLYLARYSNEGLTVLDISDPASPVRVAGRSLQPNFFGRGLTMADDTLWVAADSGLWVFNLTQPEAPELLDDYDTSWGANGMVISGDHAFLTEGRMGLHILDLSNPDNPVRVGGHRASGWPGGVAVQGEYAYVVDYSTMQFHAEDSLRLQVLNVRTPSNPELVGGCDLIATGGAPPNVTVSGNHAYVCGGPAGLQIVDISNPSQPVPVGTYASDGNAENVAISGVHAYLIEYLSGSSEFRLAVLDISQPTNVRRLGTLPVNAPRIYVSGHYAYLSAGNSGVEVLDLSDPTNPRKLSTVSIKGWVISIAVLGEHIVVGSSGFQDEAGRISLLHAGDPHQPQLVAEWIPEHYDFLPVSIGLRRDRLYVADAYRTLYVVRIDGLPEEVRLTAQAGDDALYLAWPSTATGFAPESSLSPTATTWNPVAGTPQLIGEEYQLIVPRDDPARFFRLRKP